MGQGRTDWDINRGKPDVKYHFAPQTCHMVGGPEFFLLVFEMAASFVVLFFVQQDDFIPAHECSKPCLHIYTPPDPTGYRPSPEVWQE